MSTVARALETVARVTRKTTTTFQNDIISFVVGGAGHGIVKAVPGSGKSTTLEMCVIALREVAPASKGIVLAFGNAIAASMRERLDVKFGDPWDVKTLNGLGHGILSRDPRFKSACQRVDKNKTDIIYRNVVGYDQLPRDQKFEIDAAAYGVAKMVGLLKSHAVGTIVNPLPVSDMYFQELMDKFDVDAPDGMTFPRFRDLVMMTFEKCINTTSIVDFDDQLYMPIRYGLSFPYWYKYIFVDESQDLNLIQLEMVKRLVGGGRARALFVGDEWQAIFGFRGAASDAMQICQDTFNATPLPLSICWRCPTSHIALAAEINPDIMPAPGAVVGRVETIKHDDFLKKAADGHAVLCRTTAPLVETAFSFIREGKKAYVKGFDIGTGLKGLLAKIAKRKGDDSIYKKISDYKNEQIDKIQSEEKLAKIVDRLDTLMILAEDCAAVAEVEKKISEIFSDKKPGICCSTIHRAKGLEFGTVFIIHPELMPHPMAKTPESKRQELNLKYVALTRAMDSLYMVTAHKKATTKKKGRTRKTNPDA